MWSLGLGEVRVTTELGIQMRRTAAGSANPPPVPVCPTPQVVEERDGDETGWEPALGREERAVNAPH